MTETILTVSLLLQIAAAVLALRLIRVSGRPLAWVLIAAAISLMAVRRSVTLYHLLTSDVARPRDLPAELVALAISILMVWGIGRIAPLIRSIREAEKEVRQLVESAPDAMVIADADDRIALVNAAAVRLFGHSRHQMIGQEVTMLIPERFRERHRARRSQYHASPRPRLLGAGEEVFGLHRDGHEIPIEVSVSPMHTGKGEWVVAAIHDLTTRREAQEALRESEGRYRSLLDDVLDSSSVGVCILDKDCRVVWVNRAYQGYFGLRRGEVIGFDARRLWGERLRYVLADPRGHGDRLLATYDDPTSRELFEFHVLPDEGREEAWLEHRSQPIEAGLYRGGRIEHYTDVTTRKRAEERIGLFANIARNMQIGLLVYRLDDTQDDRTLRLYAVNPEGLRLLRMKSEDLLGQTIDEAFPGLREHGIPELFADVIRTGEKRDVEEFQYGDHRVLKNVWSFRAFPLPDQCVGIVFESIAKRKQAEELVQTIAAGVAGASGEKFFQSLVINLAHSLGLEFAIVGEVTEPDKKRIRTLAHCSHGEIVDNITYDLEGTPCQHVVGQHLCCYPRGVSRKFPRDHVLQEMEAESYVGTPLFDAGGDPLGLIAVLGRKPLEDAETAQAVLQIFASRAAAEVERLHTKT